MVCWFDLVSLHFKRLPLIAFSRCHCAKPHLFKMYNHFLNLPLSQQRPSPAPWCSTVCTWSCPPPWTTGPMSCWRPRSGPRGATVWAPAGPMGTPVRAAGRAWPAGPSASWRGWYHARTGETGTGIGAATGRWAAIGAARSSARSPALATTSAHCDTHTQAKRHTPTHVHTQQIEGGGGRDGGAEEDEAAD